MKAYSAYAYLEFEPLLKSLARATLEVAVKVPARVPCSLPVEGLFSFEIIDLAKE